MGLKRLEPQEAEQFIKVDDDQLGLPAAYFTLTPDEELGDNWEKVTYYTNRRKEIKIPKGMTGAQYIYVLSNDTMPGLLKIGFTKNKPSERVKQINSATGVAEDFVVEYQYPCFNAHELEQVIHKYLEQSGLRHNKKKEFFNVTLMEAVSVVEKLGEPYKMEEDESIL